MGCNDKGRNLVNPLMLLNPREQHTAEVPVLFSFSLSAFQPLQGAKLGEDKGVHES